MSEQLSGGVASPTPDMRFTIFFNPRSRSADHQRPLLDLITNMTLQADEAGFDAVFLTEHHLSTHNPYQNSLQYGAYLAPQLKHMHIGLAVVIATLWQPVRMVEQCNLLDQLTNGKCIIGFGPGGSQQDRHEFDAFGRIVAQSESLFEQTMAVAEKLWAFKEGDEPFEFETPFEKGYIDRPVNPASFRKPKPIMARATYSGRNMAALAAKGMPMFHFPWPAEETAERLAPYWTALYSAGHSAHVVAECRRWTGTSKWIHVAETHEEAERYVDEAFERLAAEANEPGPSRASRALQDTPAAPRPGSPQRASTAAGMKQSLQPVYGTPDSVIAQLKAHEQAGVGNFMGMFLRDIDEAEAAERSFKLFIDEVLPHFQSGTRDPYEGLIPKEAVPSLR